MQAQAYENSMLDPHHNLVFQFIGGVFEKETFSFFLCLCLHYYVMHVNQDNASTRKGRIFCQRTNKQMYAVQFRRNTAYALVLICLSHSCECPCACVIYVRTSLKNYRSLVTILTELFNRALKHPIAAVCILPSLKTKSPSCQLLQQTDHDVK